MKTVKILPNYINGKWDLSQATETLEIINPATLEVLAKVPLSPATELDQVAEIAQKSFNSWRQTPVTERIRYLFKLRELLEQNQQDLAETITLECGKTLAESLGELQRAIENVEVACGVPSLIQGYNSEDIARGIDEMMIRQPLGVVAIISPFNFPGMIPFWFFPYAIACGNTCIIKPSEKVPLTMQKVFALIDQLGLPPGVINLINGGKETVDAILENPQIKAISFVGSTALLNMFIVGLLLMANGREMSGQGKKSGDYFTRC